MLEEGITASWLNKGTLQARFLKRETGRNLSARVPSNVVPKRKEEAGLVQGRRARSLPLPPYLGAEAPKHPKRYSKESPSDCKKNYSV